MRTQLSLALLTASLLLTPLPSAATPITFSASGALASDIQGSVDAFRTALGTQNPNVAGSFGSGRREINWDGVGDAFSAPNNFPANFFNSNSPRGVVFSTPGTGFQLSATAVSGTPVEFGNIDPSYTALFATFSAQRLFTPLGSTITDVKFFIPGSTAPAVTNGFGAVFTDVDQNVSSLEFFDLDNLSLGSFPVPTATGDQTLSFLGVRFTEGAIVSRVRITSGNSVLAAGNTADDLTVLDDFIYGEPVPVPEPASLSLVVLGSVALWRRVSRRRR